MNSTQFEEGIYQSDFGALAPRFSGFTSAFSSFIIIYVVLSSERRLSTIYHRIMICMALSDMMSSIAIGLTTLPMPQGTLSVAISIAGTRLGNNGTCVAQGFFYTFGLVTGLSYYAVLSVYYACAISLRMQESTIQKYVEPLLHIFPITLGLMASVPPLFHRLYSVSLYEAWCAFTPYPIQHDIIVLTNMAKEEATFEITIATAVCITFIIILISLAAVVCRVKQTEKSIKLCFKQNLELHELHHGSGRNRDSSNEISQQRLILSSSDHNRARDIEAQYQSVLRAHQTTKVILIQSMAYILVYVSVLFWPIMTFVVDDDIFVYLFLVFFPLQGFFNMVIFLGHKVYSHRSVNQSLSCCVILRRMLWKSPPDPVYVYRISIVEQTIDARGNVEAIDIEIQSEIDRNQDESDLSDSSESGDDNDEENNGLRRRASIFYDGDNSARIVDDGNGDDSSHHVQNHSVFGFFKRHKTASTDNQLDGNDDTNSNDLGCNDSIDVRSSRNRSMMGLGLMLIDDPSLTIEEQSQLGMNIERKGSGNVPSSHNNPEPSSPEDCSVPSRVHFDRNKCADSGVNSSLVNSLDDSGSYKCVGDGDRSSMCDLSGFGLSEMGTSFQL